MSVIVLLVSFFFVLASYVGVLYLFYKCAKHAKASTLAQLIAELVPGNTAGWTTLSYLVFFLRAVAFVIPAIGLKLTMALCSWAFVGGVDIFYKVLRAVEDVKKSTTSTNPIPASDPAESQPKAD